MNTINEVPGKGFSELLASMAQVSRTQKAGEPEQPTQKPTGQGMEVVKRQLTVNESFWNMVMAQSVMTDGRGNPQPEVIASASTSSADAAMRLRLACAYGTVTTEALTGRSKARYIAPPAARSMERAPELSVAV